MKKKLFLFAFSTLLLISSVSAASAWYYSEYAHDVLPWGADRYAHSSIVVSEFYDEEDHVAVWCKFNNNCGFELAGSQVLVKGRCCSSPSGGSCTTVYGPSYQYSESRKTCPSDKPYASNTKVKVRSTVYDQFVYNLPD